MTFIDKVLRWWRVRVAIEALPEHASAVFDIGCDDGYLLGKFPGSRFRRSGCDPRLAIDADSSESKLLKGFFPAVLANHVTRPEYDAIFALAVFEHFTEEDLIQSSRIIHDLLADDGRLIVTVPHPFVDKILAILLYCGLIEGQALEEHHGFRPESLVAILSRHLKLTYRKTFQFGLNNLFVFEKVNGFGSIDQA
jgi:SAM-dependent methyltransferase